MIKSESDGDEKVTDFGIVQRSNLDTDNEDSLLWIEKSSSRGKTNEIQ